MHIKIHHHCFYGTHISVDEEFAFQNSEDEEERLIQERKARLARASMQIRHEMPTDSNELDKAKAASPKETLNAKPVASDEASAFAVHHDMPDEDDMFAETANTYFPADIKVRPFLYSCITSQDDSLTLN